jgi:hypothetical protein
MPFFSEEVLLPVQAETVFKILSDIEVLLRLSPVFSLKKFKPITSGEFSMGTSYEVVLESYAKRISENHLIKVKEVIPSQQITWHVEGGLLREVSFKVEGTGNGLRLTQQFFYEADNSELITTAPSELSAWLKSIGEYSKLSEKRGVRGRVPKFFMDKVWLRLTLPERKIALIIVGISAIELFLLILLVLAWNLYKGLVLTQKFFGGGL